MERAFALNDDDALSAVETIDVDNARELVDDESNTNEEEATTILVEDVLAKARVLEADV